jgi:curli biogenesis system outer membrane secretion channel CsgG
MIVYFKVQELQARGLFMKERKVFLTFLLLIISVFLIGCMEQYVQPTARVDTGVAQQLPPYSGPRARLAVAKFEWKVGGTGTTTTIKGVGAEDITITHEQSGIMTGLRDMLTTALVQSGRFRVLERQELSAIKEEIALGEEGYAEESSAIKRGKIKGADLLVVAAITGWEPGTSGTKGGIGAFGGGVLGGVLGGIKKSSLAMDIRIIDTSTSEVLAATRIEGEARDVNLGALAGGLIGNVGLGGFLSTYAKTPMEKAIRIAINEAVKYIVSATPPQYFKY